MKWKQWVIGTMAAGLWLGAAQAAPMPVTPAPAFGSNVETVQYYYGPPRRYAPPPRRYVAPEPYYRRRAYAPPRAYYPAPRPAYRYARPAPRYYAPPRAYSKDQVRDWNRRHGL
ncbi:MAG: hypothetical protein ABWY78_23040 [Microvirga sp.]